MSFNITEANAVNVVLDAILGPDARDRGHLPPVTPERVREALAVLARGAHRSLMAGYSEQRFRETWAEVQPRMAVVANALDGWDEEFDAAAALLERLWGRL